jgi:hypothetical protein
MTVTIVNPAASFDSAGRLQGSHLKTLEGKVIGFIDNTKPNFNLLADDMAALFVRQHGAAAIVRHRKRAPSDAAPPAMLQDVQERCDLVIAGSGD